MKKLPKLSNHNYLGTCTICGKPVHNREKLVASKPKHTRCWVYAHAECFKAQLPDSGVRLK